MKNYKRTYIQTSIAVYSPEIEQNLMHYTFPSAKLREILPYLTLPSLSIKEQVLQYSNLDIMMFTRSEHRKYAGETVCVMS